MPQRTIVAIGGLPRDSNQVGLYRYLLSLCGVDRPRVCLIPTASGDAAMSIREFFASFESLCCEPAVLNLFARELGDVREHLLRQHLVVVCDGNAANLLALWREHGVDQALAEAWQAGIVLSGWGAGALCWFESGVTRSYGPPPQLLNKGLGLLSGSFCAHFDSDQDRRRSFETSIEKRALPAGFGSDDGVALRFAGDELTEVVALSASATAYRVQLEASGVRARPLQARTLEPPQSPLAERAAGRERGASKASTRTTVAYTDGACSGNPGPGGWAWAVAGGRFASGAERHSTNQRMEVTAAYEAVLAHEGALEVVSDSTYVVNCFKQRWWEGWLKRGWTNSQKKPVANRDLWEPFIELVRGRGNVSFRWVKGHSEDPMNQFVDELAVEASQSQKARTGRTPSVLR